MMVFMPLVVVLIGQFCREVIGGQDLEVAIKIYDHRHKYHPLTTTLPLTLKMTTAQVVETGCNSISSFQNR